MSDSAMLLPVDPQWWWLHSFAGALSGAVLAKIFAAVQTVRILRSPRKNGFMAFTAASESPRTFSAACDRSRCAAGRPPAIFVVLAAS
jgi:hypothetical protein